MYVKGHELSPFPRELGVIAQSNNASMWPSDKPWPHAHERTVVAWSGSARMSIMLSGIEHR